MSKLTLGTSGTTYKTARKGENLAKQLADSDLGKSLNLVASGHGWKGFNTKWYEWDEMQNFYHSLDMYLSTSTVEGLGYGVLEALACGIPVIIPKNVGIYDELPDINGIFRYDKGDFKSMCEQIEICIDLIENGIDSKDRYLLNGSVKNFTAENWSNDHISIFEDFLYNSENELPSTNGKCGIYYVAYGQQARECFIRALTSVRKYLHDIPVCLVSDTPIEIDLDYQFIEYPDNDIGARGNKTLIYQLAPQEWEYVLYLDSDTEIISHDVMNLFQFLRDGYELIFCMNPEKFVLIRDGERSDNKDELKELTEILGTDNLIQVNGGVLAFRRCKNAEKVMNGWHKEWQIHGKRDQLALDRILFKQPIKMLLLGVEFNTVTRYYDVERSAGILHHPMTARRHSGKIQGRLDSPEAWAAVHPDSKPKDK